jgi:hypothetical protein
MKIFLIVALLEFDQQEFILYRSILSGFNLRIEIELRQGGSNIFGTGRNSSISPGKASKKVCECCNFLSLRFASTRA